MISRSCGNDCYNTKRQPKEIETSSMLNPQFPWVQFVSLAEAGKPVFLIMSFQVMAPNRKIFALKRIKLQGKDSEASKGFVDEITLLQRLRGKQNIIQLVDAEVCSCICHQPVLPAYPGMMCPPGTTFLHS